MSDGDAKYRILGVLGEGGYGKVYRARLETSSGFSKDVAVKVLHEESPPKALLERFRDEARILGLLRDRAIVGVEPPVRLDGRWAVVMDFVDGSACNDVITRRAIPPGVAVEIIGEVARALHNAYNTIGPSGDPLHLLHRDVKPDNIQVTPSGDVMLLDFGIARANFKNREFKTQRSLGGTPGYIAPERLEAVEDHRGDVYSLGVVLHELVMGTRPKFAPSTMEFTGSVPEYAVDELEVSEDVSDPIKRVLELAAWMRAYDLKGRPSARQVEAACRELRRELPAPWLREWAETNISSRTKMDMDERVGRVLMARARPSTPNPKSMKDLPVTPTSSTTGLALGALLGGGTLVLFGLLIIVVGVIAVVVLVANALQQPLPPAAPVPTTVQPAPEAEPEPEPEPVEPRVIRLPGAAPAPSPRPSPQPAPALSPTPTPSPTPRARPTGTVVVRTVPSGATVEERGVVLTPRGGGYALPPGLHLLTLVSPTGERTSVPVEVSTNVQVDICYSFDTNSHCGG